MAKYNITNTDLDEDSFILNSLDEIRNFYLSEKFLEQYKEKEVPWGFDSLSYVTYKRTYARKKIDEETGEERLEDWWETCERVISGLFTFQKAHCKKLGVPWDNAKARETAKIAYDRMFNLKWLPPGRGIWMMGTDFVYKRGSAPLQNCAFISTENIDENFSYPFVWTCNLLMNGVGIGFDTKGKDSLTVQEPKRDDEVHVVDDSKEGWARLIERTLDAFVGEDKLPVNIDYSEIRPKGAPIRSFGGIAPGPEPLKKCYDTLLDLYGKYVGKKVDSELIVDTMNIVARCVVSGGVRRSALLALGDKDDEQYLNLKEDAEKVEEYRWSSNNSVCAEVGMDYSNVVERTQNNGEPGYIWMENSRKYGRMKDDPNWDDYRIDGYNPCAEMGLESGEMCTLVETFPEKHDDLDDYKETLKVAYLYAKTVTLVPTHVSQTNAVMMRNRRIGCSMSGIVQALQKHGRRNLFDWCDESYEYLDDLDRKYSEWLCIPRSVKKTTVKPSGTTSLLAGATPGIHYDHSPYYIRRVRIHEASPLVDELDKAGYNVEDAIYEDDTKVIEFPVKVDNLERGKSDVSIWEKMELVATIQKYWSDNAVSATISFDKENEAKEIPRVLEYFEDRLKTISFLPSGDHNYKQAPYEEITKEKYEDMKSKIDKVYAENTGVHDQESKYCSGEACKIDPVGDDGQNS